MSRGVRPGRRQPRALVIGAVLIVAAGAVVLAATRPESTPASPRVLVEPAVTSVDVAGTTWYCAEGTAVPNGRADETIAVANSSGRAVSTTVTVMAGGAVTGTRTLPVPARTQVSVRVGDIAAAADPGVVVESDGPVVVTHLLRGNGDVAGGACARGPSPSWHFALGTTLPGAQQWLALFNPFPDDAIVDLSFLTGTGLQAPESLQGLVVPARSRVAVGVQDAVRREAVVASEVSTRRGRVIAEQSLVLAGAEGRRGLTLSLGAPDVAPRWVFASGAASAGRQQLLALANPGDQDAQVQLAVHLDGAASLDPQPVTVPPRTALTVDVGARVPAGTGYWYEARVVRGSSIVAEALLDTRTARTGTASSALGTTTPASQWVVTPGRASFTSQDVVGIANPGRRTVTVRARLVTGGTSRALGAPQSIAPGRRVVVDLGAAGVQPGGTVVLVADGGVVADRESASVPGGLLMPAVPVRD